MHFLLTCLVPLCTQVFCILTYPWSRQARCSIPVGARRKGCPPATKRKAKGEKGTTASPPLAEIPHGGGLEGRCIPSAEGLPHHGTGEHQGCTAQGRTRSPAQQHQELLQLPPGRSGIGLLRLLRPPGRGRRTTLPGQEASVPGCPGAAVTDPARPREPPRRTKGRRRPGNVPGPQPSCAVSPGGEPQPGGPARPEAGAPHPPLTAASGPAAGTLRRAEPGGKGRNATAPAAPRDGGKNGGGSTMRPAQPLPLPVTKAPQPRGCLRFAGLRGLRRRWKPGEVSHQRPASPPYPRSGPPHDAAPAAPGTAAQSGPVPPPIPHRP